MSDEPEDDIKLSSLRAYPWRDCLGERPEWVAEVKNKSRRMRDMPLTIETEPMKPKGNIEIHVPTQRLLDAFLLGPAWPWPYRLFAYRVISYSGIEDALGSKRDDTYDTLVISFEMNVFDAQDGTPTTIRMSNSMPMFIASESTRHVYHVVRTMIRDAVLHEMNEAFQFAGRSVHNPHEER